MTMDMTVENQNVDSRVLLELRDYSVSAEGQILFSGLNVCVNHGEIVCFSSPSGSGKSTFLRSIALLIDSSGGQCLLKNQKPEKMGIPNFRRKVIYMDQTPVFLSGTVEYNLERSFSYKSANSSYSQQTTLRLLDRVKLPKTVLQKDPNKLSIGEQQRVSLVRTLLLSPDVYLLDEPTSSLDDESAEAVESLIKEKIESEDSAVLIATHKNVKLDQFCTRKIDLMRYTNSDAYSDVDRTGE